MQTLIDRSLDPSDGLFYPSKVGLRFGEDIRPFIEVNCPDRSPVPPDRHVTKKNAKQKGRLFT